MSTIPSMNSSHVEAAIAQIEREGVPPKRESTKFHLLVDGRSYPPKYVVSLAASFATGRELRPDEFSGGVETNRVLQSMGFTVVGPGVTTARTLAKSYETTRNSYWRASRAQSKSAPASSPTPKRLPKRVEASPDSVLGDAAIVRIVVEGSPATSPRAASEILLEAFDRWPASGRATFTLTPGGFLCGEFPAQWSGNLGWNSSARELDSLVSSARPLVAACLTKNVLAHARPRTKFITLGVDLISKTAQAELIAIIDCGSGEIIRWTGKSYPTASQERSLFHVADIDSHLLEIAGERVLILGCHDLNMFSARARANQSPNGLRRVRCDEMARAVRRFKPTVVLQHPHSTDTPNIWRMPWACIARDYPSIHTYASGISYFSWHDKPRRPLNDVLDGTRSDSGVADVVVRTR